MFGVVPALIDNDGKEITEPDHGNLVIKQSWPGQVIVRTQRTAQMPIPLFLFLFFSLCL
jgi:hypothetical protein